MINREVRITRGDVTIAGQTSPGGITVRGIDTTEEPYCDQQCGAQARGVDNVVIRHVRSRPANGTFPDGLRLRYARWVMVDHVSIGNAEDEAVELSYANNITLQNTLIAETVGDHADRGGMLINYTNPAAGFALDQISLLRNNWNRILGRFPELSRESGAAAAGTTMQIEITNNLFWDQGVLFRHQPHEPVGERRRVADLLPAQPRGQFVLRALGVPLRDAVLPQPHGALHGLPLG